MNKLADADTTWIESILLDGEDFDATVTLNVPMDATASSATFEEIIDYASPAIPDYLHEATKAFTEATVRFIRERAAAVVPEGSEVRCTTCTSPCCARVFSEVAVSAADIAVMIGSAAMAPDGTLENVRENAIVKRGVVLYPQGEAWNGYVGVLRRTSWQGEGDTTWENDDKPMACVFLDTKTSLCTIYDIRPEICRSYSAHDCDEHEQGSQKLIMLRRKAIAKTTSNGNAAKETLS